MGPFHQRLIQHPPSEPNHPHWINKSKLDISNQLASPSQSGKTGSHQSHLSDSGGVITQQSNCNLIVQVRLETFRANVHDH